MFNSSPPQYSSIIGSSSGSSSQSTRGRYPQEPAPSNASAYTLATITDGDRIRSSRCSSPASSLRSHSDRSSLLSNELPTTSYGTIPHVPASQTRRILLTAGLKMAALFIVSTAFLGGTLWLALPRLDEEDRPDLRIPKSFAQLKALNLLLKKYRDIYPVRIVICYVTTYLFLQAFSLPGSMYLSILGGAVWGVPIALPLACACVATGATLCYLIAAALGPALLVLPKWKAKLDTWSATLASQRENLLSYLIVLRIAPFPPHWVVNVLAPHLGIGIIPFWVSTFLGIFGVTVIHTTIGGGLDDMTSAKDFHLISWKNFLGLSAVVVGVLIPVGLRYALKKRVGEIALVEDEEEQRPGFISISADDNGDTILAQGPLPTAKKGKGVATGTLILLSDSEDEDEGLGEDRLDEEEDEILESGPRIVLDDGKSTSQGQSASVQKTNGNLL